MNHLLAQLLARVDHSTRFAEGRVATRVIDMNMGVHEDADGLSADALDRRHHLVGDLSVLRVDRIREVRHNGVQRDLRRDAEDVEAP